MQGGRCGGPLSAGTTDLATPPTARGEGHYDPHEMILGLPGRPRAPLPRTASVADLARDRLDSAASPGHDGLHPY
jgi:hypothetical protein